MYLANLRGLHDCYDIALGILEPGGLPTGGVFGNAEAICPGAKLHIVLLELDAFSRQCIDLGFDIFDLKTGNSMVGFRWPTLVHANACAAASTKDKATGDFHNDIQAQSLLIKITGAIQIGGG